jgi:rhamnosyltransferase
MKHWLDERQIGFQVLNPCPEGFDLVGSTRMTVSDSGSSSRVGAVVVLYQPEAEVLENLRILAAQVDALVIVDNGSSEAFRSDLAPFLNARVELIRHAENLGIATGFNTGIRRLIALGCGFSLTFDQDSQAEPGFVQHMLLALTDARQQYKEVLILAPHWKDVNSGIRFPNTWAKDLVFRQVRETISSGNLIDNHVFSRIGFLEDGYFIDGVDTEFHLRCKKAGFPVVQTARALLFHSLGVQHLRTFLFVPFIVVFHSHVRKYYIARNRIQNYKKYAFLFPFWFLIDLSVFFNEIVVIVVHDRHDVWQKLKFTWLGVRDGFGNRMGQCPYV